MIKKGLAVAVILLFIGVAFSPSIQANEDPVTDLDCEGFLDFTDIMPGETVTDSFYVENIGEPGSELNWEIESYPDWGTWWFDPEYGIGLIPEDGAFTVEVEIVAPDEPETQFTGEVKIVNSEDSDDFCIIDISLVVKIKSIDDATPIALVFQLIAKLRNHKDIQNVESEDDVLQIIEGDEELNSIFEQISGNDCECGDDSRLEWNFPITCMLLLPLYIITFGILVFTGIGLLQIILAVFGYQMNCFWAPDI